ncbi:MAG: hypothetical protein ACKO7P_05350 [Bacteroidota bacterium]
MKYFFYSIALSAMLVSCSGSKKGAWSDDDKKKANDEIKKVESSLDILGDKKQKFIDCYLEKVEDNYDNFDAANIDEKGCEKLAIDCMKEAM